MTAIPGTVGITGLLAPKNAEDTHPTHEDTYGKGGFRTVADETARDAIPTDRLKVGMLVYCIAENAYYRCTDAGTPTWVEAAMGGVMMEGVGELVTTDRTILPADNRLFLESDASGSTVTPIVMTIDQAEFSLDDDEGWQVTIRVGHNDDGDAVPVYAACSTSEMAADDALWITSLYSEEEGAFVTIRYVYAGSRRGRFLVVAGRGTWTDDLLGAHNFSGGSGGSYIATMEAATIDLVDETAFEIVESAPYVTAGVAYTVEVTPTVGTGQLTIEFYQDVAKYELVYTLVVSLSDPNTYRASEAFGFELETAGTLYAIAYVSGVPGSETFDISLKAAGLEPSAAPTPIPSPYGQGIEDDGGGLPRIALASNSGLDFDVDDKLVILPDVTAPVTLALDVGGASVTGAVTTTTDEDIAAKKRFTAVGSEALATEGPPVDGTYLQGHEVVDSYHIKWRCIGSGTPGDWQLADSVADTEAPYYTAALAPGADEVIEILTIGNVGFLQRLEIFGVVDDPDDYSSDFRARIYPNTNLYGRDLVWQGVGIVRQSYLTSSLGYALTAVPVNDENQFNTDEGVVIFEAYTRYEFARISARTTGQISIDEAVNDGGAWDADTLVCGVTQFDSVPFRNTDATPENQNRVFLQIRNDSDVNTVTFYIRVLPLSLGFRKMVYLS